jgi:hypothetical protein
MSADSNHVPHFEASGGSPPEDGNHKPVFSTIYRLARPSQSRQDLLSEVAEVVTDALKVAFEYVSGNESFPTVRCRECGALGRIGPFKSDSWDRVHHEPKCRIGAALWHAARISSMDLPTAAQASRVLVSLRGSMVSILKKVASERGLEVVR